MRHTVACAISVLACAASHAAPLELHYNPRPPYQYMGPHGLEGLVGGTAVQALQAAHIPFEVRETPAKRQLALLQANEGPACMVGWLKLPSREKLGKFSAPVSQDQRPAAITWAGNRAMPDEGTLRQTMSNKKLRLLLKEGFSYGPRIDAAIAHYQRDAATTTGETRQMLEMVRHRHADYFFVPREEADEVIARSGYPASDFRYVYFSDVPTGYQRHLWCTRAVPDDTLRRIDAALAKQR